MNSFYQDSGYVLSRLDEFGIGPGVPVLVCSENASEVAQELAGSSDREFWSIFDTGLVPDRVRDRQDLVGLVERHLCARSERFVGNRYSSFSTEIRNLRTLAGRGTQFW